MINGRLVDHRRIAREGPRQAITAERCVRRFYPSGNLLRSQ